MYQLFLASERGPSPLHRDSIGTLNVREKKLIQLFRSLSPADQKDLLFLAKKMVGLDRKEEGS